MSNIPTEPTSEGMMILALVRGSISLFVMLLIGVGDILIDFLLDADDHDIDPLADPYVGPEPGHNDDQWFWETDDRDDAGHTWFGG